MAFSFSKKITIDAAKCGTADVTDFPMLFVGDYSFLATTANGGGAQHASGYDIYFYSDAALTSKLDHEIVSYSNNGRVLFYVRIPTLYSGSRNTEIYIAYGDAAISTNPSLTTTWDTNHKRVYHLKDNAASTAVVDSSQSASNGTFELATTATNTDTVAQPSRGLYGRSCILFDNTNGNVTMGGTTPLVAGSAFTISWWDFVISDNNPFPSRFGIDMSGGTHFQGFRTGTGTNAGYGNFFFAPGGTLGSPWGIQVATCPTVSSAVGSWHHIAITGTDPSSATAANHIFYYDGVVYATANSTGSGMSDLAVNRFGHDGADSAANCLMDEWRITSGTQRSASWITAEYNNQRSPQTFYKVGDDVDSTLNETQWK